MMLADLGARVIKVETPGTGDDTRGWGPPFVGPADGPRSPTYFLSCNRNKQSIVLDLKSERRPGGADRAGPARDVLLENFRPGVLDRLGFAMDGCDELNPRWWCCRSPASGTTARRAAAPATTRSPRARPV